MGGSVGVVCVSHSWFVVGVGCGVAVWVIFGSVGLCRGVLLLGSFRGMSIVVWISLGEPIFVGEPILVGLLVVWVLVISSTSSVVSESGSSMVSLSWRLSSALIRGFASS